MAERLHSFLAWVVKWVNPWIVGCFVVCGVFFVFGSVSAFTISPPSGPAPAPITMTWDTGDDAYDACNGHPYFGILLYDSVLGKAWMAPFQLTTSTLFTFTCENNISTDDCTYPITPNYWYEICNDSGTYDSLWTSVNYESMTPYEINAPLPAPTSTSPTSSFDDSEIVLGLALLVFMVAGGLGWYASHKG